MAETLAKRSAGTKFFIGTVNPTSDETELEAETSWTEVGEVTNIPEFGKEHRKIEHKPLNSDLTFKILGGSDSGQLNIDMAKAPTDAGQAAVLAAFAAKQAYNFKIEFDDQPVGSSMLPTTILLAGKIFAVKTNVQNQDSLIAARVMIEIDGDFIETPAGSM
jgi:hypothetical protein